MLHISSVGQLFLGLPFHYFLCVLTFGFQVLLRVTSSRDADSKVANKLHCYYSEGYHSFLLVQNLQWGAKKMSYSCNCFLNFYIVMFSGLLNLSGFPIQIIPQSFSILVTMLWSYK